MQDATMFSALPVKNVSDASKAAVNYNKNESSDEFSSALQKAHGDRQESRLRAQVRQSNTQENEAKVVQEPVTANLPDEQIEGRSGSLTEGLIADSDTAVELAEEVLELDISAMQSPELAEGSFVENDALIALEAQLGRLTEDELAQVKGALEAVVAQLQTGEQTPEQALTTINDVLNAQLPSGALRESLQAWLSAEVSIDTLQATAIGSNAGVLGNITEKILNAINAMSNVKGFAAKVSDNPTVATLETEAAAVKTQVSQVPDDMLAMNSPQMDLESVVSVSNQTPTKMTGLPAATEAATQTAAATAKLGKNEGGPVESNAPVNLLASTTTPAAKGPVVLTESLMLAAEGQVSDGKSILPESPIPVAGLATEKAPLTPALRGFTVQTAITPTVGNEQWGEAVGQKVLWLAKQNISFAQLRLDPPDLGPMQIRIQMQNDQAHVTFVTQQPHVREVLDQNLLRLRDMFDEQGIDLVDVDVSDQSQGSEGDAENSQATGQASLFDQEEFEEQPASANTATLSLVDHYA